MRKKLFNSFFMGGYECADHINRHGERVNLLKLTHHDKHVEYDYNLLLVTGIKTVREGLCWSEVEKQPFTYNFENVGRRIKAASKAGIQQIWDICHFGFPDDLYPTHPKFSQRFAAVCDAFARYYRLLSNNPLLVIPINEISYLAWMGGEARLTAPFQHEAGFDIKYHLCKAAIQGINAIRNAHPGSKIFLSEPLIHVHCEYSIDIANTRQYNNYQYQAADIITGGMCPELGGSNAHVDALGLNYYYNCQWIHMQSPLPWPDVKGIRKPLSELLLEVYNRYNMPVFLSETGHFNNNRALWLNEVTQECLKAIQDGVDLKGICLYPLISRPDWDNVDEYHYSGLWDDVSKTGERLLDTAYFYALKNATLLMAQHLQNAAAAHIVSNATATPGNISSFKQ